MPCFTLSDVRYNIQCTVLYVQADTSLLEERHRQQLRDLEEAMKSTWEAKSKVRQHTHTHSYIHTHAYRYSYPHFYAPWRTHFIFLFILLSLLLTFICCLHDVTYRPSAFSLFINLSSLFDWIYSHNFVSSLPFFNSTLHYISLLFCIPSNTVLRYLMNMKRNGKD